MQTPAAFFSNDFDVSGYRRHIDWGGGGVSPTMDLHPVQGGVVMLLDMLHSKDPGISSGCLGL